MRVLTAYGIRTAWCSPPWFYRYFFAPSLLFIVPPIQLRLRPRFFVLSLPLFHPASPLRHTGTLRRVPLSLDIVLRPSPYSTLSTFPSDPTSSGSSSAQLWPTPSNRGIASIAPRPHISPGTNLIHCFFAAFLSFPTTHFCFLPQLFAFDVLAARLPRVRLCTTCTSVTSRSVTSKISRWPVEARMGYDMPTPYQEVRYTPLPIPVPRDHNVSPTHSTHVTQPFAARAKIAVFHDAGPHLRPTNQGLLLPVVPGPWTPSGHCQVLFRLRHPRYSLVVCVEILSTPTACWELALCYAIHRAPQSRCRLRPNLNFAALRLDPGRRERATAPCSGPIGGFLTAV